MKTPWPLFGAVVAALVVTTPAAAQVGDGIDRDDPVNPPLEPTQAEESDIEVRDNAFEPKDFAAELDANGSVTVRWAQTGDNPHTVTADDGSFDSHGNCPPVCMRNGETFEHTFEAAGTIPYYCKIHGGRAVGTCLAPSAGTPSSRNDDQRGRTRRRQRRREGVADGHAPAAPREVAIAGSRRALPRPSPGVATSRAPGPRSGGSARG